MMLVRRKMLFALLGCSLLACTLLVSRAALAQGHPGGGGGAPGGGGGQGPGGRGPGGGGMHGGPGDPQGVGGRMQGGFGGGNGMGGRGGVPGAATRGGIHTGSGGLGSGPVGRWWDDKGYSSALNLRPDQRKRMDSIFNQNRNEISTRYQTLRTEESKLEEATRDSKVSQGGVFSQIDRVAQAREALEKTNTRLLGEIRKELDADQAARMQTLK